MHKPARPGPGAQFAGGQAYGGPRMDHHVREAEATWVKIGYLGAIILAPLIPVAIYLTWMRRSAFVRYHAATALNLSLTAILYELCCLILGGLLLLDSFTVALAVAIPLGFAVWVCMLRYLIAGIDAAGRGERHDVPGWICAQLAR